MRSSADPVHGSAVQLECSVPLVEPYARRLLHPFAVADWPAVIIHTYFPDDLSFDGGCEGKENR